MKMEAAFAEDTWRLRRWRTLVLNDSILYAPGLTLPRPRPGPQEATSSFLGNAESLLRALCVSAGQRLESLLLWLAGLLSQSPMHVNSQPGASGLSLTHVPDSEALVPSSSLCQLPFKAGTSFMFGVHVPLTEPLKVQTYLLLTVQVLVSFTAILRDTGQGSILPNPIPVILDASWCT